VPFAVRLWSTSRQSPDRTPRIVSSLLTGWVPLALLLPGTSRHRPDEELTRVPVVLLPPASPIVPGVERSAIRAESRFGAPARL
jgi:hypothetical protein